MMRRRIFLMGAAVSGMVWVVLVGVWVRGLLATDVWVSYRFDALAGALETRAVWATDGWVVVERSTMLMPSGVVPQSRGPLDGTWSHQAGGVSIETPLLPEAKGWFMGWYRANVAAVAAAGTTRSYRVGGHTVGGVRLLPVIVLASVLPGVWVWRRVRGGRARGEGCCAVCGYDLRASPERCPECGARSGGE